MTLTILRRVKAQKSDEIWFLAGACNPVRGPFPSAYCSGCDTDAVRVIMPIRFRALYFRWGRIPRRCGPPKHPLVTHEERVVPARRNTRGVEITDTSYTLPRWQRAHRHRNSFPRDVYIRLIIILDRCDQACEERVTNTRCFSRGNMKFSLKTCAPMYFAVSVIGRSLRYLK